MQLNCVSSMFAAVSSRQCPWQTFAQQKERTSRKKHTKASRPKASRTTPAGLGNHPACLQTIGTPGSSLLTNVSFATPHEHSYGFLSGLGARIQLSQLLGYSTLFRTECTRNRRTNGRCMTPNWEEANGEPSSKERKKQSEAISYQLGAVQPMSRSPTARKITSC